jgi:hypothetical protein
MESEDLYYVYGCMWVRALFAMVLLTCHMKGHTYGNTC